MINNTIMADDRFDGMFLSIAQQSQVDFMNYEQQQLRNGYIYSYTQGIEPLLDYLFSFMRRKTDFFVGASVEQIENTVLGIIRKHRAISEKDEAAKKKAKEKEELLKKQKLEKKRKVIISYMCTFYVCTSATILYDIE